jgi:hypothetical protein
MGSKTRFFIYAFVVLTILQILFLLVMFLDPLYLISKSKLNISGTIKERLCIVIASNRKHNVESLTKRSDFSPLEPYSLVNKTLLLPENKEQIIKNIYIESVKLCDKPYCLILEDDVVFIYNNIKEVLFNNLISYNNDNNYVFDCSKKGFFRYNFKVNGNGALCRIYSRYAIRQLLNCLPSCNNPVDICIAICLENFEEKRFLLTQHAGFKSSRW